LTQFFDLLEPKLRVEISLGDIKNLPPRVKTGVFFVASDYRKLGNPLKKIPK
jgi:hypothetical protein